MALILPRKRSVPECGRLPTNCGNYVIKVAGSHSDEGSTGPIVEDTFGGGTCQKSIAAAYGQFHMQHQANSKFSWIAS